WDLYVAHPYHAWERGLNEHTNGLIRQYLPRGTSFEGLTSIQRERIVEKITNRSRKALGYRNSNEVFSDHLFALQNSTGIIKIGFNVRPNLPHQRRRLVA
ncbi:MAG: hypothetical protein LBD93_08565, partial [Treponema sp.]|nr:hypothetical protein [Treponema sp.]